MKVTKKNEQKRDICCSVGIAGFKHAYGLESNIVLKLLGHAVYVNVQMALSSLQSGEEFI